MPTVNSAVKFAFGEQANFTLAEKDLSTIYFCTDTARLFLGETEYSRPIQHGTALPVGFLPPNSLFVKETGAVRDLYYSKDGASWEQVAHLPAAVTGGVFGNNTAGAVAFGGSIKIPKVTVDNNGSVTAIEDVTVTLPQAPEDAEIEVTAQGSGPIVGSVTKGDGTTEIVVENKTLAELDIATETDLTAAEGRISTLETQMSTKAPLASPTFTGTVTVPAPTNGTDATTKTYVDTQDAATLQDAKDYADSILGANDAMVFKGTVGGASSGATVTDFGALTDYETGWTYRVIEAGTYAGSDCEIGDLLIAVADYDTSFKNADWTIAQTNIDGAVISDAALASGNILTGAGGQKAQDSGVSLSSIQTSISSKIDKDTDAVATNIAVFEAGGNVVDSGTKVADLATAQSVTDLTSRVGTNETSITALQNGKVDKTTTVAGHALSGNVTIALDDISDVDLTTAAPTDGQSLVFNGTKWVPGAPDAGSVDWANVQNKPTNISLDGDVTGTLNLQTGSATNLAIKAGSIVNADISDAAAIAQSKISGLTTALAGKLGVNDKAQTAGTADQVANALTIKLNGTATSPATFNGSADLEVDITPESIGAQPEGTYLTPSSNLDATKLTGGPIPASVTATTASAGDNTAAIATTAFVTTAVSNATLKWQEF